MTIYPEGFTDPKVEAFLTKFYQISDTPTANAEYVDQFTDDATLIMGLKTAIGDKNIRTLRESMWGAIVGRHHVLTQVFPFQTVEQASELGQYALTGTVEFTLKNEKKVSVSWGAKMDLLRGKEGEQPKIKFYQVYVDSTPVVQALTS
ncbi:uncharacterized protein V1518DRAFT_433027 [Limtongia smithiae]|uniref:uncharacterized protein n=1 Tax=Limtongia smithiae TaxID=1125753 RepID=UPI0034CDF547